MRQEPPKETHTTRASAETRGPALLAPLSIFKPRPPGESLVLKGEGHVTSFPPVPPEVLARQIVGSNAIEGIAPSPELAALAGVDRASLGLEDI